MQVPPARLSAMLATIVVGVAFVRPVALMLICEPAPEPTIAPALLHLEALK